MGSRAACSAVAGGAERLCAVRLRRMSSGRTRASIALPHEGRAHGCGLPKRVHRHRSDPNRSFSGGSVGPCDTLAGGAMFAGRSAIGQQAARGALLFTCGPAGGLPRDQAGRSASAPRRWPTASPLVDRGDGRLSWRPCIDPPNPGGATHRFPSHTSLYAGALTTDGGAPKPTIRGGRPRAAEAAPTGTSIRFSVRLLGSAGVAQLVEHQLPKLRVAGSNPVARFLLVAQRSESPATAGNAPVDITVSPARIVIAS